MAAKAGDVFYGDPAAVKFHNQGAGFRPQIRGKVQRVAPFRAVNFQRVKGECAVCLGRNGLGSNGSRGKAAAYDE